MLAATIGLWFYFAIIIESAGKLQTHESGASMKVSYIKDEAIKATRWINFFAFLWFTQFLFGCQDFVIAGTPSLLSVSLPKIDYNLLHNNIFSLRLFRCSVEVVFHSQQEQIRFSNSDKFCTLNQIPLRICLLWVVSACNYATDSINFTINSGKLTFNFLILNVN